MEVVRVEDFICIYWQWKAGSRREVVVGRGGTSASSTLAGAGSDQ